MYVVPLFLGCCVIRHMVLIALKHEKVLRLPLRSYRLYNRLSQLRFDNFDISKLCVSVWPISLMEGLAYRIYERLVWVVDQQFTETVYIQAVVYLEQIRVHFNRLDGLKVLEFLQGYPWYWRGGKSPASSVADIPMPRQVVGTPQ